MAETTSTYRIVARKWLLNAYLEMLAEGGDAGEAVMLAIDFRTYEEAAEVLRGLEQSCGFDETARIVESLGVPFETLPALVQTILRSHSVTPATLATLARDGHTDSNLPVLSDPDVAPEMR